MELGNGLTQTLLEHVPHKQVKPKPSHPWVNNETKILIWQRDSPQTLEEIWRQRHTARIPFAEAHYPETAVLPVLGACGRPHLRLSDKLTNLQEVLELHQGKKNWRNGSLSSERCRKSCHQPKGTGPASQQPVPLHVEPQQHHNSWSLNCVAPHCPTALSTQPAATLPLRKREWRGNCSDLTPTILQPRLDLTSSFRLLKTVAENITPTVILLFCTLYSTGITTTKHKQWNMNTAHSLGIPQYQQTGSWHITPVFKKGEKYKNYHPISLTCIACILSRPKMKQASLAFVGAESDGTCIVSSLTLGTRWKMHHLQLHLLEQSEMKCASLTHDAGV